MAGHATATGDGGLHLEGLLAAPDGSALVRCGSTGRAEDAIELGREVAEMVLAGGGQELLAARPALGTASAGRRRAEQGARAVTGPRVTGTVYLVGAGQVTRGS